MREPEYVTVYKEGQKPLKPFKCELDAYIANGWSTTKPTKESSKKADETKIQRGNK